MICVAKPAASTLSGMLDGLYAIEWVSVHHAYGPGQDVPEWITALAGTDLGHRRDALEQLWNAIRHQGDLCEATAVALPFLAAIAVEGDLEAYEQAELLYFIASSGSAALRDSTKPEATAVLDAVRQSLPRLCELLADGSDAVIACVAFAATTVEESCPALLDGVLAARRRASTSKLRVLFDVEATLLAGDAVSGGLLERVADATPDGFGFYRREGDFDGVSDHQQAIEAIDLVLELGGISEMIGSPPE